MCDHGSYSDKLDSSPTVHVAGSSVVVVLTHIHELADGDMDNHTACLEPRGGGTSQHMLYDFEGPSLEGSNTLPGIILTLLYLQERFPLPIMREIKPDPGYGPWGPFMPENYQLLRVTQLDIALASTAFALAGVFAIWSAYVAVGQTRQNSRAWKSVYLWLVWLEWTASVVIAIECLLFLLRIIRPSFYFYMSILLCWTIQIQLLPQIILNRIRIILPSKSHGQRLIWGTAFAISLLCISVYIIWIPARLQISDKWIRINKYWDRVEKILYLLIDAALNIYFICVVKRNLVQNGMQKYSSLVRWNQRIIVVSILMDVMIIAAMDIPNGFVYAIFHPLAYLIKLNIELSMARSITIIALGRQSQRDSPWPTNPKSDSVPPAESATPQKPRQAHRKLLRRVLRRDDAHAHAQPQPSGIVKRQEFVATHASTAGPEHVDVPMDVMAQQSGCGSSGMSSERPYDVGSSDDVTSPGSFSGSRAASMQSTTTTASSSGDWGPQTSIWRSTNWSDVQI